MAIELALSVQQPYAWLIVNGFKDIENRTWSLKWKNSTNAYEAPAPVARTLIHTGKKMSPDFTGLTNRDIRQYLADKYNEPRLAVEMPLEYDLGGIVGSVQIVRCVTNHTSKWFFGKYGFVLRNPQLLPFTPCKGAMGLFPVDLEDLSNGLFAVSSKLEGN